jgi:alpha-mannosidase
MEWRAVETAGLPLALSGLKRAEDEAALILRIYEPAGARGSAQLSLPDGWRPNETVNLLEERLGPANTSFRPFQLRSFRIAQESAEESSQ